MEYPQIILISLILIQLLLNAHYHGTESKVNFWGTVFGNVILLTLLYLGGFFNGI